MKRIMITCFFAIACFSAAFAQMGEEELRQQMERMEAEMADVFELWEQNLLGSNLFLDTMMFKIIPLDPNSPHGDPYQLHQFLDQFFGAFGEENRMELDHFFKEYEQRIPAPEDLEEERQPGEKQEDTQKKKRKKTRIYRL